MKTALLCVFLVVMPGCAGVLTGGSTFNATEQCQIDQYTDAHPHMWKHKIRWDT